MSYAFSNPLKPGICLHIIVHGSMNKRDMLTLYIRKQISRHPPRMFSVFYNVFWLYTAKTNMLFRCGEHITGINEQT